MVKQTLVTQLTALTAAAWLTSACGSSSGGAPASQTPKQTGTSSDAQLGSNTSTGTQGSPTSQTAAGTNPGTSTVPATGGDEPAGNGGDPSDQEVCSLIQSNPASAQHFSGALQYLCQQGGLAKLRQAVGQLQTVQNTTDSKGTSTFALAAAMLANGTPEGAQKLDAVFCSGFANYKAAVGAAAFTNVASITPSDVTANSCDFDFKSTAVLFIQPEYIGTQSGELSADGSISVGLSYLTRSVSTVVDSTTMGLAVKHGTQVYLYTYLTSVAPTSGFADTVYQDLVQGTTASLQGTANAVTQLSQ